MALPAGFVLDPESTQSSGLPSGFVLDQEAPPGDYRVEAARKGLAGSAGMVSGAANVVFDTLSKMGINPFELGMRAAGAEAPPRATGVVDAYRQAVKLYEHQSFKGWVLLAQRHKAVDSVFLPRVLRQQRRPSLTCFLRWRQRGVWACLDKLFYALPSRLL